jgi:hypothetical protein
LARYADSKRPIPDRDPADASVDIPGVHVTDTPDIVTVLSGEIHAVMETGETLLRAGDTYIMRGRATHGTTHPIDR